MSKRNNLFNFATSELSQDAFLGWLLSFAMKEHEQEDAALAQCARALLKRMYQGMKPDETVTSVELQKDNIDILVTIGDCSIIIEDKTFTGQHDDQIERYKRELGEKRPETKIITVYYKIDDQCNLEKVDCNLFRRGILEILQPFADKTNNAIFRDYVEHLQEMEEEAESYAAPGNADIKKWTGAMHTRFFQHLRDQGIVQPEASLGWGYVSNQTGGFFGLWWHWIAEKQFASMGFAEDSPTGKYVGELYLQIENAAKPKESDENADIIALKYSVNAGELTPADWEIVQQIRWALYEKMKEYFGCLGVPYQKKTFRTGTFMSVGYVTYDMTNYKDRIQAMQKALDGIVDRYHYVIGKGFEENP